MKYSSGFVYFASVLGITGTKSATEDAVRMHVERIKRHTKLPVAVGFGINTPDQAAAVAACPAGSARGPLVGRVVGVGRREGPHGRWYAHGARRDPSTRSGRTCSSGPPEARRLERRAGEGRKRRRDADRRDGIPERQAG